MTTLRRPGGGVRGQATVELAIALPLVAVVLLVVLQLALVTRDAVALTGAARAASRRAVVDADPASARASAVRESRLDPSRMAVSLSGDAAPGGYVTVVVRYRAPTDVPLVGAFVGDVALTEHLVVVRE
jgi:Flp pilus assembly protein TadG